MMYVDSYPVQAVPKSFDVWRHHNGNEYLVLELANESERQEEYPRTVVYRGANGKTWAKTLTNFLDKMTLVHSAETREAKIFRFAGRDLGIHEALLASHAGLEVSRTTEHEKLYLVFNNHAVFVRHVMISLRNEERNYLLDSNAVTANDWRVEL